MAKKIPVGLGSTEESNEFLRSLWATLRATFPGIAWQYIPRRFGTRRFIRLGFASIPDQDQVELGITYKNRGVIDAVVFDKHPLAPHPLSQSLKQTLKECVLTAKRNIGNTKWSHFKITVHFSCDCDVALYQEEHFRIEPIKPSWARLIVNVNAYDAQDARFILKCKLDGMLDLLAACTNTSWVEEELKDMPQTAFTIESNTIWSENDWLDDVPVTEGHLCLSSDQVECINKFAGDRIAYDDNLFRSAHHFHKAVRLVRHGRAEDYDLATALFMAALEVVSLDRRQKQHCKACRQVMHGISQRIVETSSPQASGWLTRAAGRAMVNEGRT